MKNSIAYLLLAGLVVGLVGPAHAAPQALYIALIATNGPDNYPILGKMTGSSTQPAFSVPPLDIHLWYPNNGNAREWQGAFPQLTTVSGTLNFVANYEAGIHQYLPACQGSISWRQLATYRNPSVIADAAFTSLTQCNMTITVQER